MLKKMDGFLIIVDVRVPKGRDLTFFVWGEKLRDTGGVRQTRRATKTSNNRDTNRLRKARRAREHSITLIIIKVKGPKPKRIFLRVILKPIKIGTLVNLTGLVNQM